MQVDSNSNKAYYNGNHRDKTLFGLEKYGIPSLAEEFIKNHGSAII